MLEEGEREGGREREREREGERGREKEGVGERSQRGRDLRGGEILEGEKF